MISTTSEALKIKEDLKDLILSESEITEKKIARDHIYTLCIDDKIVGNIHQDELKKYIANNNEIIDKEILVKKIDGLEWTPVFEHVVFQRRKLQVIKNNNDNNNEQYYLIEKGQSKGPFTKNQVQQKLDNKETLQTNDISHDGISWCKIYEHSDFDRRKTNLTVLPDLPTDQIFDKSKNEVEIHLLNSIELDQDDEAISNLAYMGQLTSIKDINFSAIQEEQEKISTSQEYSNYRKRKFAIYFSIFFAVIATALILNGMFFNRPSDSTQQSDTKSKARIYNRSPVSTNTKVKKNKIITRSIASKIKEPRKPVAKKIKKTELKRVASKQIKSFKSSIFYKNKTIRKMSDNAISTDDYYYDENNLPVEQDPVRSKLAKETIDPEEITEDVELVQLPDLTEEEIRELELEMAAE